ncbi:MAG: GNAT family N-acetyltransferase [Candidatus Sulfobium sp.]
MTLRDRIFFACIPALMEDGNVRLRPLRIGDGAFLKSGFNRQESLRACGLSSPVSSSGAAIRRWIKGTYDVAWCIEIDSRPAGFAGIYRLRPGESAEASLMVFDGKLRRRGYGSRVFRMVSEMLVMRTGVKKLTVSVLKENQAALSFWGKMGFEGASCNDGVCSMELDLSHGFPLKIQSS